MKTSELTGAALDWAVAKCEGMEDEFRNYTGNFCESMYSPSTDWAQGGPLIERHITKLEDFAGEGWSAFGVDGAQADGPTPLIAAMRCYVASKLGDEVEV